MLCNSCNIIVYFKDNNRVLLYRKNYICKQCTKVYCVDCKIMCDNCKENYCLECLTICKYSPIITNHQPLTNSLKIHDTLCENCKDKCNICNINSVAY